jgi:hypothetical protein
LFVGACGSSSSRTARPAAKDIVAFVDGKSVFGPAQEWMKSDLPEVGGSGLYPAHTPEQCEVAVLRSGEDSFAARTTN